jgi:PKD repeat protein
MYTTAGTYTVTLTATNAAGSNTISQTGYITVSKVAAVPAAAFEATATSGNIPLAVQFVDSSANTPTSWVWSFGDGGVSNVQDPSHTYTVAGTYTVTLTATNTAGSNTVTETNYITVSPAIPVASFTANITTGPAPLSVSFTDTSTNSPTNWSWSFGDGGTSSDQNIVYTYTTAGAYSVGLTAYNSAGSNVTTESDYIVVNSGSNLPGASFTSDVTQGSVPLTVQFTDKSTNVPTSWAWSFGDGNASTMQNPSHTYTSVGTYAVALTATNADGSNTLTQSGYITVSAVPATTVQAMTYATTTTVPELTPATTTSAPAASETSAVSGSAATSAANGSSGMLILVVIIILIVIAVVFLLAIRKQNRGSRRSGGREL